MIDSKNPRQKLIFDEYNENHSEYHDDLSKYKKELLTNTEEKFDPNHVKDQKRKQERNVCQQYCRKPFAQFSMDILFGLIAYCFYYQMFSPLMEQKGLCTLDKGGDNYVTYWEDSEERDAKEWINYIQVEKPV